jgi:acyl-CoA thioester hydrolase
MPVLECYSKYIRPAYYDEMITIRSTVKEMPGTRIRYEHELFNEEGKLIHVGYTVLAFLDRKTMKPCGLPPAMQNALAPFFANQQEHSA